MFIPVFVEPRLTEAHTFSVWLSACGMERISSSSAFVMPLAGNAL